MAFVAGISSYENDPKEAGQAVAELLKYAESAVAKGHWKTTPLYLGATAGMRLLE